MTTARTGITGPNGTRKVTFLSGYIFLSLMAAKAVGMYWKKRKTTLKVANVSKEPDNKSKKAKIPEIIMATTGAFLEFVFPSPSGKSFSVAHAAPKRGTMMDSPMFRPAIEMRAP